MMKITDRIKTQPNTATRVRRYNAVIRAIMDLYGVSQKEAQGPLHALDRRELYELAKAF